MPFYEYSNKVRGWVLSLKIVEVTRSGSNMKIIISSFGWFSFFFFSTWFSRCFTFADMAWYERKIAATIFADPPESSYEEVKSALKRWSGFENSHWHHDI